MIPRSRAEATGPLSWLAWAFLGNDDGGIYGERDHYAGLAPTPWLAVQWWFRNPAANLFKVVLAWKRDPMPGPGWTFWRIRTPQAKWLRPRQAHDLLRRDSRGLAHRVLWDAPRDG